jgi:tetratricopeptide (TPR) repeat protein
MLFTTEAKLESRKGMLRDLDAGRITQEQACRRALELDPHDFSAYLWLGQLHRDRGDNHSAEQCFWRAVEENPWFWSSYICLVNVIPPDSPLVEGLFELACRKLALDEEEIGSEEAEALLNKVQSLLEIDNLNTVDRPEIFAEYLAERRKNEEPPEVTTRLWPYRLIHELHANEQLSTVLVDDLIHAGPAIVPLLLGTIRGWAASEAPEDSDFVVENTLALLGETGDPSVIPELLELVTVEDPDIAGAATWTFERIVERYPHDVAPLLAQVIPGLDGTERMAIMTTLLRHPVIDPAGQLIASLGENLGPVRPEEYDPFFPLLVSSMILMRGLKGVGSAREWLARNSRLMPGKTRRKCAKHIAALEFDADLRTPPPAGPLAWTVYDICAGEAIWEDDEDYFGPAEAELADGFGDEDSLYVPEPVHRDPKPGRNDLCWCGSGKKYKKCHLDSDQSGNPPPIYVN